MSTDSLPQLCRKCGKQKAASLCKKFKSRSRFNSYYWICLHCLETPEITRGTRQNNESYPERKVREALQVAKIYAKAEYEMGGFIYDFAFPNLRLLIEIDSRRYHRSGRQVNRDKMKDQYASGHEWKLVRINAGDSVGNQAVQTVLDRKRELGL